MAYIDYLQINSLESIPLIAGNSYTLEFAVFEENGITPIDLGGASVAWVLCPYGQASFNVLDIIGTITDTNKFEIDLSSNLTENLDGRYLHQPIITAFTGEIYKPGQGVILFTPAIARAA